MGAVQINLGEVAGVLWRRVGLDIGAEPGTQADAVLWGIRLPRIALGLLVGAAFGFTGAALQGAFRNPLADPQLLGIGPGASLGAAIASLGGGTGPAIVGGIVGGVLTALLIKRLGDREALEPSRFVLAGVAVGLAASAWVGFVVFSADSTKVPPIEFWLLGSLGGSTWRTVGYAAIVIAVASVVLLWSARRFDLLALGEAEARHLGVDVDVVVAVVLVAVGTMVGGAVGTAGVIGFVGLLVPHLVRSINGPAHRPLLLGSALGGAAFVAIADLLARTLVSPLEIPVGLVTAAVGGPFFLWLLLRKRAVPE